MLVMIVYIKSDVMNYKDFLRNHDHIIKLRKNVDYVILNSWWWMFT